MLFQDPTLHVTTILSALRHLPRTAPSWLVQLLPHNSHQLFSMSFFKSHTSSIRSSQEMTRQTYRKTSSEKQNGLLKVQDPFDGYRCFQKNKTSLSFLLLLWVFLLLHLIVFLVEFRKKTMSRLRRKEATLHTRFLLISLPLHFFLDFYSPNFSSSSH